MQESGTAKAIDNEARLRVNSKSIRTLAGLREASAIGVNFLKGIWNPLFLHRLF